VNFYEIWETGSLWIGKKLMKLWKQSGMCSEYFMVFYRQCSGRLINESIVEMTSYGAVQENVGQCTCWHNDHVSISMWEVA